MGIFDSRSCPEEGPCGRVAYFQEGLYAPASIPMMVVLLLPYGAIFPMVVVVIVHFSRRACHPSQQNEAWTADPGGGEACHAEVALVLLLPWERIA